MLTKTNPRSLLLSAGEVFTATTRQKEFSDLGIFHLRGFRQNLIGSRRHQIILSDIQDDGHSLLINVHYGESGAFRIENDSTVFSNAVFQYKHSGQTKKNFKPGDVLTAPVTHTLIWEAKNLSGQPITVTLTIIPLPRIHGLTIQYSLTPKTIK